MSTVNRQLHLVLAASALVLLFSSVIVLASGSTKVGLAWPGINNPSDLVNFVTPNTKFILTFTAQCPSQDGELGLTCFPTLNDGNPATISAFTSTVVAGFATTALGFNEPNEAGGANLTPAQAAVIWQSAMQPLKSQGYTLVSPATSSNPNGRTWMQQFLQLCSACTVDAIAVHFSGSTAQDFIDYIEEWHDAFGLPIYVTDFICFDCSADEEASFFSGSIPFMDGADFVVVYFADGLQFTSGFSGVLANPDGTPSVLGSKYINDQWP